MKKIKILAFLLLGGMITIMSCGPDPVTPPSEEEVQLGLLAKTWAVTSGANAVTLDGQDEDGNWTGFTVSFAENGTYTASNVSEGREVVWPVSGTWAFKGAGTDAVDVNTIVRDDGVEITITVDEATLKMSFTYTDPGGRTEGTEGAWIFNMGS
jgi:hypothetical protein